MPRSRLARQGRGGARATSATASRATPVGRPSFIAIPSPATTTPASPRRTSLRRRRVVVVGAGVAGLEAAWTAAARGHEVTLFGRSAEPGGKLRLLTRLPGGEALSSVYDWQVPAAQRAGGRFELGEEAGPGDSTGLWPNAVILATGARMTWPRCLPRELCPTYVARSSTSWTTWSSRRVRRCCSTWRARKAPT